MSYTLWEKFNYLKEQTGTDSIRIEKKLENIQLAIIIDVFVK